MKAAIFKMAAFRHFVLTAAKKIRRRAKIELGREKDFPKSKLRIDHKADAIYVKDLTNAGRRGKMVDELVVMFLRGYFHGEADLMQELIGILESSSSYLDAKRNAQMFVVDHLSEGVKLIEHSMKGVTVEPLALGPLTFNNGLIEVNARPREFHITDLRDRHNVPRAMETNVTSAKKFYTWLAANFAEAQSMNFSQILEKMRRAGIPAHSYLSN